MIIAPMLLFEQNLPPFWPIRFLLKELYKYNAYSPSYFSLAVFRIILYFWHAHCNTSLVTVYFLLNVVLWASSMCGHPVSLKFWEVFSVLRLAFTLWRKFFTHSTCPRALTQFLFYGRPYSSRSNMVSTRACGFVCSSGTQGHRQLLFHPTISRTILGNTRAFL